MSTEMRERALSLLNTSYLRNVKEDTVIDGVEIKSVVNYMILFHEQESQPINEFNKETIEAGVSWMNKYLKAEKETAELREENKELRLLLIECTGLVERYMAHIQREQYGAREDKIHEKVERLPIIQKLRAAANGNARAVGEES